MTKPLTPDPLPHKSVDGYDGPPPPDDWGTDLDHDLTELDPAQEWDDYLASVNDETEDDYPPIPTWQREGEFLVGSIKDTGSPRSTTQTVRPATTPLQRVSQR